MKIASTHSTGGPPLHGMTSMEIARLVNRYIGVTGGYLGDFTYASHAAFYPEYCDLDIDPYEFDGTTRERFIQVVSSLNPGDQAKIIRGVVERFPIEAGPDTRNAQARDSLLEVAARLERAPGVLPPAPQMTSATVDRALQDAETLIQSGGPTSAVDRVQTALHGYLRLQCQAATITYEQNDSSAVLLRKLRSGHPCFQDLGPRAEDIVKILNASGAILDALLPLRNRTTLAHANEELLSDAEAHLVINVARSLLHYLDAKLATASE